MSFQVGQIRCSWNGTDENPYMTNIPLIMDDSQNIQISEDLNGLLFRAGEIQREDGKNFSSSETYYINYKLTEEVSQNVQSVIIIKLAEVDSDGEILSEQILDTIKYYKSYNDEFCFRPNQDCYNYIIFDYQRTQEWVWLDRIIENQDDADPEITVSISSLTNIIDDEYSQIGLQSRPGFLFTLDGEEIRVGRSGIYELNETDIPIKNLGVVIQNTSDICIIDWRKAGTNT